MPCLERPSLARSRQSSSVFGNSVSTLSKNTWNQTDCEKAAKACNVFYVWYAELCRRQNSNPVNAIRPGQRRNDKVLDFAADRIKVEDWTAIINALRKDTTLHVISIHSRVDPGKFVADADTEDKVRNLKKFFGAIATRYVLRALVRSVCVAVKSTEVLCFLELDGLHIKSEYLESILRAIAANKTLKYFSVKSCPVGDEGCSLICETLHGLPNIQVLNLSGCNLTHRGAQYLSKLIKYQQINRYCESWHNSLRYEEPAIGKMAGLRRITINNNPEIGDDGLSYILDELLDDLWIRALDMQRCNITEQCAERILEVVEYSRSLEVFDLRHNDLSAMTMDKIFELLKDRQIRGDGDDYKWCFSSTTLNNSAYELYTSTTNTRSMTAKTDKNSRSISNRPVVQISSETMSRKTNKEFINVPIKADKKSDGCLSAAREQILNLYESWKEEIKLRTIAEKKCAELQKQVDDLLTLQKHQLILKEFSNMQDYINKFIEIVVDHNQDNKHTPIIMDLQRALEDIKLISKPYETAEQSLNINSVSTFISNNTTLSPPAEKSPDSNVKCQMLFKNFLGEEINENQDTSISDYGFDADECVKDGKGSETSRSNESESMESYEKLLEELSHDEAASSGYSDMSIATKPSIENIAEMTHADAPAE